MRFTDDTKRASLTARPRCGTRRAIAVAGLILAVGALAPVGALGKAGGTDRPIKNSASGTTVLDLGTLAFTSEVTGQTSHMGRTATHLDGVVTPTGPDTFTIAGSGTSVAANGSELIFTFSGSGTSDASGNSEGPVVTTFTGGTGRFEGASGSVTGSFSQVLTSMSATTATYATAYSQRGTISP